MSYVRMKVAALGGLAGLALLASAAIPMVASANELDDLNQTILASDCEKGAVNRAGSAYTSTSADYEAANKLMAACQTYLNSVPRSSPYYQTAQLQLQAENEWILEQHYWGLYLDTHDPEFDQAWRDHSDRSMELTKQATAALKAVP
jgi:hypothetical protein